MTKEGNIRTGGVGLSEGALQAVMSTECLSEVDMEAETTAPLLRGLVLRNCFRFSRQLDVLR